MTHWHLCKDSDMKVWHKGSDVYSPHIAPGWQPKSPLFLLFIWAFSLWFPPLRPLCFCHLRLLLLLFIRLPFSLPPAAVLVQVCHWWGESMQMLTQSSSKLSVNTHSSIVTPTYVQRKQLIHNGCPTLPHSWFVYSWTESVALCRPA